uniref:CCHC-type domain-containing protein n=1 Tax=Quercus lobata TaxID=97700 RepID=A0A7N2R9N8_QUELO
MAAAVAISSTVKYGIIGVGMMGREHLINLHHLHTEGVAVFAIVDPHVPSQDLALQLAQSFNWPLKVFLGHRELLDSGLCDVLVVSTPNMTHYEILIDIINHSKPHHVLVEKPLCTTVAHCKEVVVVNDKEEETVEASNMVEPVDLNAVEITDNIVFRKLLRGPRYFDPPNSGWGASFNCGEEGHTMANCTAAKRKKPFFVCGSSEHNAKQCSKVR